MLQLLHCKKIHSCALRAGHHACRRVAVPPPPLQLPDWPAKVTVRPAGGRSLTVTCYWRHNLGHASLHWTKRWTGLSLTLRVNDRYPKFWFFLLKDHIDGYRRLSWNGWCENMKPIGTNLKKLSPKNRVSWGLKSIVASFNIAER